MTRIEITMYTDGSCLKNPNGPGGCSAILRYEKNGKPYEKRISQASERTTNNRMEITAIIIGLQMVKEPSKIVIHSDSKYVVDAFNKHWIKKWQKINWDRGENGGVVKNVELWKQLLALLEPHTYQFIWVKGHQGNHYNELCDQMAVAAAKRQKGAYYEGVVRDELQKKKKPATIKIACEKAEWNEEVIQELLTSKQFVVIIQGSFDNQEKAGCCKYLLGYDSLTKVVEETIPNANSINEVLLKGIERAIQKIRYRQKKITLVTGNNLGFKNIKKSANAFIIQSIYNGVAEKQNSLRVMEVLGASKQIRNMIKRYEI